MEARGSARARRVAQRRSEQLGLQDTQTVSLTREQVSADEQRRARFLVFAFSLVFLGVCVTYVVLAAGDIFG